MGNTNCSSSRDVVKSVWQCDWVWFWNIKRFKERFKIVNNKEFTKRLARKLNVTQDVADETIKGMQELIFDLLNEDPKVKIGDFLVLEKKKLKSECIHFLILMKKELKKLTIN